MESNNETIDIESVKNELSYIQLKLKQHNANLSNLINQTELKKDNTRILIGNQVTKVNKDDIKTIVLLQSQVKKCGLIQCQPNGLHFL